MFCRRDGCFARILIGLLVIGVNIMYEILSILHFRLFHHDYDGLSRLNVVPMRITFDFVLQINLVGYFCCPNSISHLLVPLRVTFLLLFATSSRFRPNTRTADETFATQPRRPLCIVGVLETRAIRCMQRPFLHSCPPGGQDASCRQHIVLVFFQDSSCRLPDGEWSTVLHHLWHERSTSIGASQKKLPGNQRVTVDPKTNLCTSCFCANLCAGRKCPWCTMCCFITVVAGVFRYSKIFPRQHRYISIYVSIIMSANVGRMLVSNTGSGPSNSTLAYTPFLLVGSFHQHKVFTSILQPGQNLMAQRWSGGVSTHRPAEQR